MRIKFVMKVKGEEITKRQVLRRNGLNEVRRLWYSMRMFLGYIGGREK